MRPEELPSAPTGFRDIKYVISILKEAKGEPNTIQWVFTRSLISKAAEWGKEMAGKQASLSPMTNEDIRAIVEGFMLPLVCLQGARVSLDQGKGKYLKELDAQPKSSATAVIKENLDSFISLLRQDPSGISLIRGMAESFRKKNAHPYLVKGIELCMNSYESHWQFFTNFAREVDLW